MSTTTTQQDEIKASILETLGSLSDQLVGQDKIVHEGKRIICPENMTIPQVVKELIAHQEANEKSMVFSKVFKYRPWDGAHAFQTALMKVWGTAGVGRATWASPPELRTVEIGVNQQIQVPWGQISFEPLDATIYLDTSNDRELGLVFAMAVTCPKKYARQVDGMFKLIETELQNNSIYRGKAITGVAEPRFIDTSLIDADKVIYSKEVRTQLDANLWSLIEHTEATRKAGLPLKRAVLLGGPFGTGKSLTGGVTAQKCEQNGWTFVLVGVGDDLTEALRFARMYSPAVVFFEDIDTIAGAGSPDQVSKILDAFDGIPAKGHELIIVPTTNHVENITKGMLRPGRLDALVFIEALDHEGVIKLIQAVVPAEALDPSIDFNAVAEAMTGYEAAFVREALDRASRYAIARKGEVGLLSTQDFVDAAQGLKVQHDLHTGGTETTEPESLATAIGGVVNEELRKTIASGDIIMVPADIPTGRALGIRS